MKHVWIFAAALLLAAPVAAVTAAPANAAHGAHHNKPHHAKARVHHGHVVVKPRKNEWHWRGKWVARVRGPGYVWPRGHRYRQWVVGARLPAVFLASSYYYDGYGPLGLGAPPVGYRWVRYGSDLVLVNVRTGEIEQVAYGVFY